VPNERVVLGSIHPCAGVSDRALGDIRQLAPYENNIAMAHSNPMPQTCPSFGTKLIGRSNPM
jgi:hypothetical protein